ncbi:MAG: hypothetical protein K2I05_07825, partial [Mailhella sp.]|nr:hypothetical protein [Mailhella sp.]
HGYRQNSQNISASHSYLLRNYDSAAALAAVTQKTTNKDSARTAMFCEYYPQTSSLRLFYHLQQKTRKARKHADGCGFLPKRSSVTGLIFCLILSISYCNIKMF